MTYITALNDLYIILYSCKDNCTTKGQIEEMMTSNFKCKLA